MPHARGFASVLHVVLVAKQSAQAAPPEPQERFVKPARQRSPWQQPGQFAALQAGFAHVPAVQVPPTPHERHATPFAPHCAGSLPPTHVFPSQHPRQLAGPQVTAPVQVPPAPHVWPTPAQFVHCPPPWPQAVSCEPIVHTFPMQQPAQFAGPQGGGSMQVRPFGWSRGAHTWLRPEQSLQASPPRPHEVLSMPSVQVPARSQQPPQFCGPHRPMPWHWPPPPGMLPHVVPCAVQLVHAAPRAPHAEPSVPGRQRSPTQQPLQFEASHLRVVLQVRRRASQAWPDAAQLVQAAPFVPHAEPSVPERQTPVVPLVTQQPVAQLSALHWGTRFPHTLRLVSQTSRPAAMQSLHLPPRFPHA